jgi:hypothetical protein
MNGLSRDEINRIIYDNGLFHGTMALGVVMDADHLERFAALVAAAERERIKWDSIHSCHPHCDRPACVAVRRAREDEREMCAKVCEAEGERIDASWVSCAFAIRARGKNAA